MTQTHEDNPAARITALAAASASAGNDIRETVISADVRPSLLQDGRDLWARRGLLRAFISRDLKVRYKQTALGIIWVVLQPVLSGGVLAMIFVRAGLAMRSGQAEDPFGLVIHFMAGFVPWISFSLAVNMGSNSLVSNAHLIKKVHFPRLLAPTSYVASSLVDFTICYAVLLILCMVGGYFTMGSIFVAIPLLLLQLITAAGLCYGLSVLSAQFHDVRFIVAFVLQIGMFATVFLDLEYWPAGVQQILSWSPMTAVIDTYRAVIFEEAVNWPLVGKGCMAAVALFAGGVWLFRKLEPKMVDVL